MCQNITDKYGYPLVYAANSLILKPRHEWPSNYCTSLTLSFTTLRIRRDRNPSSITVRLLRHDPSSGGPGDVFYAKTWPSPANNDRWQYDYMGVPSQNDVILHEGDLSDDGQRYFTLRDTSFMGDGERVWVAFYVTLSLHQGQTGLANALYWLTLANTTTAVSLLQPGPDFFYRDVNNYDGYGFVNWTDGSIASPYLGILPTTNQLAWQVYLQCSLLPLPSLTPTHQPTPEPTTILINETLYNVTSPITKPPLLPILLPILFLAGLLLLILLIVFFLWRRTKAEKIREHENEVKLAQLREMLDIGNHEPRGNPLYETHVERDLYSYTSGAEFTSISLSPNETIYNDILDDHEDEI